MWRRNLYAVWLAQILSLTGFGFVLPFVPFYIQELGVTDPDQLRIWTGVLSSAPALSMAIMAPVWGLLADRFGKKPMLVRAMLFGAIVMALMSLARNVQTVLVLRVSQGLFTGTATAAGALVATGTPRDRLSYSLGFLSSANFMGVSLGPMIGGLTAEWLGYQTSFLIGACMPLISLFLVLIFVRETNVARVSGGPTAASTGTPAAGDSGHEDRRPDHRPGRRAGGKLPTFLTAGMAGLFALIMMLRFVRALPVPFLPLYVQELRGQLAGSASATGLISAGRGAVTALSAVTIVRLGDRHPRLLLVGLMLAAGGLFSLPLFFVGTLPAFTLFIFASTFFLGGVEPLVQADLSSRVSAERRGLLFGVQTSIANIGWFVAPMVGTFVSIRWGLAHVFLTLTGFLFITAATVVVLSMRRKREARDAY